jgi:hypothetical protein
MARRVALGFELELLRETVNPGAGPLARKELEVAALDSQLGALPDLGMEMARRYRDFMVQEKVFELLSAQLESARIKENRDVTTVEVLDAAIPPDRRSWPRRGLLTALAFLLSIVVGVLIAAFLDVLDRLRLADDPRLRSVVGPGTWLERLLFGALGQRGP